MYTLNLLDEEISEACNKLANNGEVPKGWVIQEVLLHHKDIQGKDADMAFCCIQETVSACVNRYFRTVKASEQEDPQIPLPGFQKLQQRYLIMRNDEPTIVSIYNMTSEELEAKAQELESMAEGCLQHADEIRKFNSQANRESLS